MQHVRVKWLKNYCYSLLSVDLLIFLGYFYFKSQQNQSAIEYWGLNTVVLVFATIHVFVTLVLYPIARKRSEWAAFVTAMVPYGLLLSAVIETSGNTNVFYRLLFINLVFMLNMVGPYLAIASAVVAWILLIFDFLNLGNPIPEARLFNVISDIVVTIAAIAGWFYFRKYYESDSDKETLAILQSERAKTNVILASMHDAVILFDSKGNVEYINPAACQMLGWKNDEASGVNVGTVVKLVPEQPKAISEDKYNGNPMITALMTKSTQSGTYHLNLNNTSITVSIVVSPVINQESGVIVGGLAVIRDVTAAKEEERRRADFISTASHEMRTPVAAIEGYLALALNDKVSKIDANARSYLEKAHASTEHLGILFQDLLTSAKAEDGRLVNHPKVIDIGTYLEQLTDTLKFSAEKKGLISEFVMGVSNKTEILDKKIVRPIYYVFVDPDRLREVITNLFDNAVKYTDQGKISVGLTADKDVVQLYIKDSGHGIPQEDIPHLFQKFYRVDNSSTRTVGGTGLGLFICKKIIELCNGRIWVDSTLGKGSTFYINIPRLTSEKAKALESKQIINPNGEQ